MKEHHHFRCSKCGAIEDIPSNQFEVLNLSKLRQGLKATSYEIIVHGLCDRCPVSDSEAKANANSG